MAQGDHIPGEDLNQPAYRRQMVANCPAIEEPFKTLPPVQAESVHSDDGKLENVIVDGKPFYETSFSDYLKHNMRDGIEIVCVVPFLPHRLLGTWLLSGGKLINEQTMLRLAERYPEEAEAVQHLWDGHQDESIAEELTQVLVIFGIGLGIHIDRLLGRFDHVCHLVILEDNPVHMDLAAQFSSPDAWLERLRQRSSFASLSLCFGQEKQLCRQLQSQASRLGPRGFGAFAAYHGQSENLRKVAALAPSILDTTQHNPGFYEDERLMLSQSLDHFTENTYRFFWSGPTVNKSTPVFIVGAGPSLDAETLDRLQSCRDRAIIVAASSAFTVLMEAGIEPDFHLELENVDAESYGEYCRSLGATKTILLAASSISPERRGIHDTVWYWRRRTSDAELFYPADKAPHKLMGPVAANAALSFFVQHAFQRIYLVGCDCASRTPSYHHASGSVYNIGPESMTKRSELISSQFRHKLRGNLGGMVWTSLLLKRSIENFSDIQALMYGTQMVFNCSDGAEIEGLAPLTPDAILVGGTPRKKARDLALLHDEGLEPEGWLACLQPEGITKVLPTISRLSDYLTCALRHAIKAGFSADDAFSAIVQICHDFEQREAKTSPPSEHFPFIREYPDFLPYRRYATAIFLGSLHLWFQRAIRIDRRFLILKQPKETLRRALLDGALEIIEEIHRGMGVFLPEQREKLERAQTGGASKARENARENDGIDGRSHGPGDGDKADDKKRTQLIQTSAHNAHDVLPEVNRTTRGEAQRTTDQEGRLP